MHALFDWLGRVDRRWIFLFIAVAVAIPLVMQRPVAVTPNVIVQDLFDAVDALPPGSRLLLSCDYGPSTQPENDPMSHAVARHCMRNDVQLYVMSVWATGPPIIANLLESTLAPEYPEKAYGRNYVNLGYKTGNQGAIQSLTTDFRGQYTEDSGFPPNHPARPIDRIPMMDGIRTLADFDLLVAIGSGFPGVKEWVQFAGDPLGLDVGGGVTAVEAPLLYPYYPQQLVGLMGGLVGAAEYETALTTKFPDIGETKQGRIAQIRMFPQTVAHLVIVAFVVLGNVSYFLGKRRGRRAR